MQNLSFVSLMTGIALTFTHQFFETRTLNNGYLVRELATYTFRIILTLAGVFISLLLVCIMRATSLPGSQTRLETIILYTVFEN
jgi:hypothetical protein